MSIFCHGKSWWYKFEVGGVLYRERTEASTKAEAAQIEAARRGELKKIAVAHHPKQRCPRFRDFAYGEFQRWLATEHRDRLSTFSRYMRSVKALSAFFGDRSLEAIDPGAVEHFKIHRSQQKRKRARDGRLVTPAAVNRDLAVLRILFNFAMRLRRVQENPVAQVRFFITAAPSESLASEIELADWFEGLGRKVPMMKPLRVLALSFLLCSPAALSRPQLEDQLLVFFRDSFRLKSSEISAIQSGKAVANVLKSRKPSEIFVAGAVFIRAEPEAYVKLATDLERLRKLPEYLGVGRVGDPPQISDFAGFTLDKDDVEELKDCKPSACAIQLPASRIEQARQNIPWNAPDVVAQVNQALRSTAVEVLGAYRREGNRVLGEYNDREEPTRVARQFEELLSYAESMPKYAPALHRYLLDYPAGKTAAFDEMIRWEKVKFGLKPTLRVVHVITARGESPAEPAYVVVGKQLYASHYFETAMDLAFCIRSDNPQRPGFYLVMVMGSEQEGLTGFKGSILRKVVTGRTASSLEKSMDRIKATLESAVVSR